MRNPFLFTLLVVSFSLALMSPSCEKKTNQTTEAPAVEVADSTSVDDLLTDYSGPPSALWPVVDSLQRLGLYDSALKTVEVIYQGARVERNATELVKCVMFKMRFSSYLKEDDYILAINDLNQISETSTTPIRQLVNSINADVIWNYYQQNRWRMLDRTQVVGEKMDDIRTWDLNTLVSEVNTHFIKSLEGADSLKRLQIADFKAMLNDTNTSSALRPTLYDFLAHRALDFFENTESALTRPHDKFTVDSRNYFGNANEYLQIDLSSTDTMSNALQAARIFQDLARFHLNDKTPDALIDLELRRLAFSLNKSTIDNKGERYLEALNKLATKYSDKSAYTQIRFKEADYRYTAFEEEGAQPSNQDNYKKAAEICEEAMQRFPGSLGAIQCENLLKMIHQKSISFENEMAYEPGEEGKFLMKYRNVDTLHFRIVKVSDDYFYKLNKYGKELLEELLKLAPVESWTQTMINSKDFKEHSTELLLKKRELGQYMLLASYDNAFKLDTNAIAYGSFWVTNMTFSYRRTDDENYEVFVNDRMTGKPLKGVVADIYNRKYNYFTRNYEIVKQESYRTNEDGMFIIKSREDYRYFYIALSQGADRFNDLQQIYQYKPYKHAPARSTTYFFTDRSIYRPGQTIYFKGIRVNHDQDNHTLEVGKETVVELYDVNYQKVSDLKVITNEYGTFSGSLTAPMGTLNGQMHIKDQYGAHYISVEEYKRPKFEVNFNKIVGEYKINDSIAVTGIAKAYAGSVLDGAQVSYRITRSARFPSWCRFRWGYYPQSPAIEIKNGQTTTDENGQFQLDFQAKEDLAIDKKFYPIYNYTITVDVTDINGETQSTSENVSVGFNALELGLNIGTTIEKQDYNKFRINTTNLNGEKVAAEGKIVITKLIEPEKELRKSFWTRPDVATFNEAEFRKKFPLDDYANDYDVSKFKKGTPVAEINFNTLHQDSVVFAAMKSWPPGYYVIEASTKDKYGVRVEDIRYITLVDKQATKNATNEIWRITPLKVYCEPGEVAELLIASAENELVAMYEIEVQGDIIQRQFITLSKSQQLLRIPIEEKHRGNLTVHLSVVKDGRSYNSSQSIIVPFTNKMLDLSFETFRDKLLPGQQETWKIKVKGPKGEKVAAEMLASMYDASLDAFASNSFYFHIFNSYYSSRYWQNNINYSAQAQVYEDHWNTYAIIPYQTYDYLNWWGFNISFGYGSYNYNYRYGYYDGQIMTRFANQGTLSDEETMSGEVAYEKEDSKRESAGSGKSRDKNMEMQAGLAESMTIMPNQDGDMRTENNLSGIKARSNLSENAFFFPHLETNENGEVIIAFTMPESLTKWKFMALAHTKDLKSGYIEKEVLTQKEIMVMPNAPRFLREGDRMTFSAKVSNLTTEDLSGEAQLMLFDALTMRSLDSLFKNTNSKTVFQVKAGQSDALNWEIEVPFGIGAVTYRVVAQAKNHTDGEEMTLPVLSNRMLITESMPLPMKGIGTKDFNFKKLIESGSSTSIKHHKLTLEYTSNPAWYAIQAMPYMMEYPYECAEQIFTRYYTNSIASNLINSSPKIKSVFESWKNSSPDAFLSNLQKNQELKSLMLEETPWVLDANDESERKKRVALLFDLNRMDNELGQALRKLQKMQVSNGGWPWFPGMPESRYITQHIVTGMGHLDKLGVKDVRENNATWTMVKQAVNYLDARLLEDYRWLKAHDANYKTEQRIGETEIQYLYARSYFKDLPMNGELKEAFDYYAAQAAKYWKNFNLYSEGMIALQAHRYEQHTLASQIMASLKERTIKHDELGAYWKDNTTGYYWYQAPIETQALLIEAFDEITADQDLVEELKVWLLKQKQTTDWKTTKATAEACYALLLRGNDLLTTENAVEIQVNGALIDPAALGASVEAGTGYFKTSWSGAEIQPDMGKVTVKRNAQGVSWGAMYWQYFEDLDKITTHETPLKLKKQLFLVENTASGPVLKSIGTEQLQVGDKVRVRIELRVDRDMEYVHMKDMRAAGFEPVNVFSQYKWQDGLGYYESTRDASTNFFFDYLRKGTYVFEYDLRVSQHGDFSNGIATIQSMYAPEFTSHSEGLRVKIK